MLRVTIEIVPFGFESEKYPITTVEIANIGGHDICDYAVRAFNHETKELKWCYVMQHQRGLGAENLVEKALNKIRLSYV